jgi:hypothetical protein
MLPAWYLNSATRTASVWVRDYIFNMGELFGEQSFIRLSNLDFGRQELFLMAINFIKGLAQFCSSSGIHTLDE